MNKFKAFDPLLCKSSSVKSLASELAVKREIWNILSSYVGWYDPFSELIQNGLDSIDLRIKAESNPGGSKVYSPLLKIIINLDENSLTVTDNGVGISESQFTDFLAPNFSFKKAGHGRGHKGVGVTYVAYGFNLMRVVTKTTNYIAAGRIKGARNWVKDFENSVPPLLEPDTEPLADDEFLHQDSGVSITVAFDTETHPKQLNWIKAENAEVWWKILRAKTGLGAINKNESIKVVVKVIKNGESSVFENQGISYQWLYEDSSKKENIDKLLQVEKEVIRKSGLGGKIPQKYRNLDFIYGSYDKDKIIEEFGSTLSDDDMDVLTNYDPNVFFEYSYTAKVWSKFNEDLSIRSGSKIVSPGIQMAADNMPQGEVVLIPLNRNIGRQNQIRVLIHFNNYSPDMGRKGFRKDLVDFSMEISKNIINKSVGRFAKQLRSSSGASADLARDAKVNRWKEEMVIHETNNPLVLENKHFFNPTEKISITSYPTREQDVIALFNQLIAGGVIRGLYIMSTNERFTYDGLFKIVFDKNEPIYLYDKDENPLGVSSETVKQIVDIEKIHPLVLEYKYSIDGLLEDFNTNDKHIREVDLCIAWEMGDGYKEKYDVVSYLIPGAHEDRPYHGVTHALVDPDNSTSVVYLILLSDLIYALNNPGAIEEMQNEKYDLM